MNAFSEIVGQICKVLLPIHDEIFYGNPKSSVAVCTLSSMSLLREIADSDLLERVAVAGRLLSENKGIDALVSYVTKNAALDTIIVCGADVAGHRAGHSLVLLHKYGVDENNRIVNSLSPDPVLLSSEMQIRQFQRQIRIIDMIGKTSLDEVRSTLDSL
jgi:tetrahydromethanopterin S-methyltransferase subunit A